MQKKNRVNSWRLYVGVVVYGSEIGFIPQGGEQ